MSRHSQARENESYASALARSENYDLGNSVRSGIRHDLMDRAAKDLDKEMWLGIAQALVRANLCGDLTPEVSDHFVRTAPDDVFLSVANEESIRFVGWKRRARKLAEKNSEQ